MNEYNNGICTTFNILNIHLFSYWILLEKDYDCACSYCNQDRINPKFGFFKGRGNHHWSVIYFKLGSNKYYLRWAK